MKYGPQTIDSVGRGGAVLNPHPPSPQADCFIFTRRGKFFFLCTLRAMHLHRLAKLSYRYGGSTISCCAADTAESRFVTRFGRHSMLPYRSISLFRKYDQQLHLGFTDLRGHEDIDVARLANAFPER